MPYGNSSPPEGAPVPPKELIGAALVVGLVAVLSISRHGAYVIALVAGRASFDPSETALFLINSIGFVGSLWLLALRRWAWAITLGYLVVEVLRHAWRVLADTVPAVPGYTGIDPLGALGEAMLMLLLIVVLGFLAGRDTREMLAARAAYAGVPTPG